MKDLTKIEELVSVTTSNEGYTLLGGGSLDSLLSNTIKEVTKINNGIEFPLLSKGERFLLEGVNKKISDFERIIKTSVSCIDDLFSKGIIITGSPGTGKTHNITKWLDESQEKGVINQYSSISGKITPVTLFHYLKANSGERNVVLLDDVEVFNKIDSLNILKAALNTGDGENWVSYGSRGEIDQFQFKGLIVFIKNSKFGWKLNDHQKAVLDRSHLMAIPLTSQDMAIKNASIVEDFINNEDKLSVKSREDIVELYKEEISNFIKHDIFKIADVDFSVRFIMKIVDLQKMFGSSWKQFSMDYIKLEKEYLKVVKSALTQK